LNRRDEGRAQVSRALGGGADRLPFAIGIILAAATAVMLPELLFGLSATDSHRYNLLWTEEFTRAFALGAIYPRWLAGSWDGLGAPTFYHYPPLFFWVAALIRLPFGNMMTAGLAATLTSLTFLAVSGLTMRAWLLRLVSPRLALAGGLLYLAAPFHLYDIYARGSLAEAAAVALLPLLPLAVDRMACKERGGLALLALAYALTILAHMPTALLASLALLPAYILYRAREAGFQLVPWCAAGLALGIALTSFYLIPAIYLLPFTLHEAWSGVWFDPANWQFWAPSRWPSPWRGGLQMLIATAALFVAVAAHLGRPTNVDVRFWAALALIIFMLAGGFSPALWQAPPLVQVQFPFRLIPQLEFVAITALVIAKPRFGHPLVIMALLVAVAAWTPLLWLMTVRAAQMEQRAAQSERLILADRRDAPTFLPAGVPLPMPADGRDGADPSLVVLPERGWLARATAGTVSAQTLGDGIEVVLRSPRPALVVARRYAYPRWQVRDGAGRRVPVLVTRDTRLVAWHAPAGQSQFTLSPAPAPSERLSLALSAGALLVLLMLALRGRGFSSRRLQVTTAPSSA
jgi:hypothetical protein